MSYHRQGANCTQVQCNIQHTGDLTPQITTYINQILCMVLNCHFTALAYFVKDSPVITILNKVHLSLCMFERAKAGVLKLLIIKKLLNI